MIFLHFIYASTVMEEHDSLVKIDSIGYISGTRYIPDRLPIGYRCVYYQAHIGYLSAPDMCSIFAENRTHILQISYTFHTHIGYLNIGYITQTYQVPDILLQISDRYNIYIIQWRYVSDRYPIVADRFADRSPIYSFNRLTLFNFTRFIILISG